MKNFSKYLSTELKLRFRVPISVFFIFIFPIFLMVMFANSAGSHGPEYIRQNIAIIMFYGILSASVTSFSNDIARYKQDNFYFLLERRAGNKIAYLFAQVAAFLVIVALSTMSVLLIAHFSYSYSIPSLTKLLPFYLKLYLYSLPFFMVSIIIGFSAKNSAMASAIAMPVMFISYFLAGMMVPYAALSGTFQKISKNFFLTQLLSDLTKTLTSQTIVTVNWSEISLSIAVIVLVAGLTLYRSSFVRK